jgi:hypothetical protein
MEVAKVLGEMAMSPARIVFAMPPTVRRVEGAALTPSRRATAARVKLIMEVVLVGKGVTALSVARLVEEILAGEMAKTAPTNAIADHAGPII